MRQGGIELQGKPHGFTIRHNDHLTLPMPFAGFEPTSYGYKTKALPLS